MPIAWQILSMRKVADPPRIMACLERIEMDGQRAEIRRDRVRVPLLDVTGLPRERIETAILAAAKEKWQAIEAAEAAGAAAVDAGRLKSALNNWELSRA